MIKLSSRIRAGRAGAGAPADEDGFPQRQSVAKMRLLIVIGLLVSMGYLMSVISWEADDA
jgi:hypothetical protein